MESEVTILCVELRGENKKKRNIFLWPIKVERFILTFPKRKKKCREEEDERKIQTRLRESHLNTNSGSYVA